MFSRLESGDIRTWSWSAGLRCCLLDGAWVTGRLAASFCGMLGAGLGYCLLDGTRLPAFVECFSSRMLLWVVAAASKCVASEVFICR